MKTQSPVVELKELEVSLFIVTETPGSVCLDIRKGKKMQLVLGWIDIHYPCSGHIHVQIRGMLPERLMSPQNLQVLVSEIFRWLEIPINETWELSVCSALKQVGMSQRVNAEGKTDRIETTKQFLLSGRDAHI